MERKGKIRKMGERLCMAMRFAVVLFAASLCLSKTAEATELIDPGAGFGIVEAGENRFLAVAVQRGDYTAVYAAGGAQSNASFVWNGRRYPLSPEEGRIFQKNDLFAWKTEAPIEDSALPSWSYPVSNKSVTAVYYNQEEELRTEAGSLTARREFEDGTASLNLYPETSDAASFPGVLLDTDGGCVAILYDVGSAYSAWYSASEFQNTELPEPPPERWWETTAGIGGITVVVVAVVGLILFFAIKSGRNGPVHPPQPKPIANPQPQPNEPAKRPEERVSIGLMFTSGDLNGAYFPVGEGVTTIGRNPSCTVRFPEKSRNVSRTHAELRVENGAVILRDTSSNGTYLNSMERKLSPKQPTRIQIGDTIFMGSQENRATVVQNQEAFYE